METWHRVDRLLQEEWNPEPISGWLRKWQSSSVSHEWIYQHVLHHQWAQGTRYRHLRFQRHRSKRYETYSCRGQLRNRVSSVERPAVVARRARLGDWEVDTMIAKVISKP
jgi:transposase, IS30 family